jgi:hypothetical protein
MSVLEMTEQIEALYLERPDRRKKVLYKEWFDEINKLVDACNKAAKYEIYDNFS